MAALVVQSRFAGLKIEDDDYPPSGDGQKSKKAKATTAVKKAEPPKKNKNTPKTQVGSLCLSLIFYMFLFDDLAVFMIWADI